MSPSKVHCVSTSDGSPLGLDRLTEHVTALQMVANAAAELVTAHRVTGGPPGRRRRASAGQFSVTAARRRLESTLTRAV
jgi:hypothetical protein